MRVVTVALIAVFVLAGTLQRAEAAMITHVQSLSIPDANTASTMGHTSITQSVDLVFPQFDPAMGDLTGVDILFDAKLDTQATLLWDSEVEGENRYGRYSIAAGYWVIGPDANPGFWYAYGWNWTWNIKPDSDVEPDFIGSDSLRASTWTSGRVNRQAPAPSSLDGYLGTDTVLLTFNKVTYSDPSRPNFAMRFEHTGLTSATVSLRYHYVPEPSSLAIWGLGIVALVFARRRNKANQVGKTATC